MREARALPARLAGLIMFAAAVGALAAALTGCGGSGSQTAARPFGPPPAAAPGIHAWAAGEVGDLLVTSDGGAEWRRQPFYLPQRAVGVTFVNEQIGWLITDAGTVLATTDDGAHWRVAGKEELQLKAIAATDARHAWVVGSAVTAAGEPGASVLFRTADGGVTWQRTGFGDALLADVSFSDARHGVLVALDRVWTTSDGGRRWKLRRQVGMAVLTSVCTGDARHAWVAGWGTQDGAPFVLTTANGGATWRRLAIDVPAPRPGALQSGQIVAAGSGAGSGSSAAAAGDAAGTRLWITCPAGVLASDDAGATWTLQKVAAGQPQAIAAADARHLVVTTTSQPILATSDGGTTWPAYGRAGLLRQPLVAVAAVAAPAQSVAAPSQSAQSASASSQ